MNKEIRRILEEDMTNVSKLTMEYLFKKGLFDSSQKNTIKEICRNIRVILDYNLENRYPSISLLKL